MTVGTCSFLGQCGIQFEDVLCALPADPKNAEPSPPSRSLYPGSTLPDPSKHMAEHRMQPSHYPLYPSMFPFDSLVIAALKNV